jgi:hypothetical protein
LLLVCQATAWVHEATPHVTCLEHGERVHLIIGRQAPGQMAPGASAVVLVAAESDAHGHEHCALQGQRADSAAAPAPASAPALFAPAPLPIVAAVGPSRPLLRLAPKTSPPPAPAA